MHANAVKVAISFMQSLAEDKNNFSPLAADGKIVGENFHIQNIATFDSPPFTL